VPKTAPRKNTKNLEVVNPKKSGFFENSPFLDPQMCTFYVAAMKFAKARIDTPDTGIVAVFFWRFPEIFFFTKKTLYL
jgi:hypothetical protein